MNKKLLSSLMMIGLLTGCSLQFSSQSGNSSKTETSETSSSLIKDSSSKHEHTYSTEWSNNETHHWHAATCEHDDQKKDEAEHTWDEGEITGTATCLGAGEITYTCTECGYEKTEATNPLDHNYGEPTYVWSSDYSTVTATRVCANDENHIETEVANTTATVTQNQTCTEEELTTYTATFENEAFETQVKEKVKTKDALDHNYGEPTYVWSDDNSTVTATRVCVNDENHVETEVANVTATVVQNQTCTEEELTTYTATFTNEAFKTQVKEKVKTKDALEHSYGEPTYVWSDDNSTVTATRVCTHNGEHVETETAFTFAEVTQEASHTTNELTTYTATFTNEAFETQVKQDVVTKELIEDCVYGDFVKTESEHYKECLICGEKSEVGTHSCTGKEAWAQGRTCDVCEYAMKAENALLAEFTFENGLSNTGVDTSVRGTGISNADATKDQEVNIDSLFDSTTFSGNTVLKPSHSSSGNSFAVKGLDTGTGDFTISFKYAMSSTDKAFYKADGDTAYVMGTATEENGSQNPDAPCFALRVGKDSSGAGYGRMTVVVNGRTYKLFEKDKSGYFQGKKMFEIRVVKKGTSVTFDLLCPDTTTAVTKDAPYSLTIELESPEDLMIASGQVLGFGYNIDSTRPGNYAFVDDIKVWNYAVDFAA